jgi:hypothetical protein
LTRCLVDRGNSYAILEGYRYAAVLAVQLESRLTYLVEEDIWVSADFFSFHRAVHAGLVDGMADERGGRSLRIGVGYAGGDHWVNTTQILDRHTVFAVMGVNKDLSGQGDVPAASINDTLVACGGTATQPELSKELGAMIYAKPVFGSLGLSLGRRALEQVASLARPKYYQQPAEFIAERFGGPHGANKIYGPGFIEQDAVINRLLIELNQLVVMPRCPRAFHAGFVGYNRDQHEGNELDGGTLRKRYDLLRSLSAAQMRSRSSLADVWPAPLQGYFAPQLAYCARTNPSNLACELWGAKAPPHVDRCGDLHGRCDCTYSEPVPDCFIGSCDLGLGLGCQDFASLSSAQSACSANPLCAGLTEGGGMFSTRSGHIESGELTFGASTSGERCIKKLAAPACAFSPPSLG